MAKKRHKVARNSGVNGGRVSAKHVGQKSAATGPLPPIKAVDTLRAGKN